MVTYDKLFTICRSNHVLLLAYISLITYQFADLVITRELPIFWTWRRVLAMRIGAQIREVQSRWDTKRIQLIYIDNYQTNICFYDLYNSIALSLVNVINLFFSND